MERIIAAAYKLKPEFYCNKKIIYKHPKIRDQYEDKYDDIYKIRIARHHAEILHIYGKEIDRQTDGFYTSYGRWVDRIDAGQIALACGQCKELHYFGGKMLDSADIFDINEE